MWTHLRLTGSSQGAGEKSSFVAGVELADGGAAFDGDDAQQPFVMEASQQQILGDVDDGGLATLRPCVSWRMARYVAGLDVDVVFSSHRTSPIFRGSKGRIESETCHLSSFLTAAPVPKRTLERGGLTSMRASATSGRMPCRR